MFGFLAWQSHHPLDKASNLVAARLYSLLGQFARLGEEIIIHAGESNHLTQASQVGTKSNSNQTRTIPTSFNVVGLSSLAQIKFFLIEARYHQIDLLHHWIEA